MVDTAGIGNAVFPSRRQRCVRTGMLLACLAGLVNAIHFPLLDEPQVHLGGAIAVFATLVLGWSCGLLVAMAAAAGALAHAAPHLGILLTPAEILFCGCVVRCYRRAYLPFADLQFWLLVGAPSVALLQPVGPVGDPWPAIFVSIKLLLLGQVNMALGIIAAGLVPLCLVRRRLLYRPRLATAQYLANCVMLVVVVPLLLSVEVYGQLMRREIAERCAANAEAAAATAEADLARITGALREDVHAAVRAAPARPPDIVTELGASAAWHALSVRDTPIEPPARAPAPAGQIYLDVSGHDAAGAPYLATALVSLETLAHGLRPPADGVQLTLTQCPPHTGDAETAGRGSPGTTASPVRCSGQVGIAARVVPQWQVHEYEQRMGRIMLALPASMVLAFLPGWLAGIRVTRPLRRALETLQHASGGASFNDAGFNNLLLAPRLVARFIVRMSWQLARERQRVADYVRYQDQLIHSAPIVLYRQRVLSGARLEPRFITTSITRLLGWTVEDALNPEWWMRNIHPEDRRDLEAFLLELGEHSQLQVQYRFRHADGSWRWIYDEVSAVRQPETDHVELVGAWVDVTDYVAARKQAEESARLLTLGRLSAGVAHELKQPLNVISMAAGNAVRMLAGANGPDASAAATAKLKRIQEQVVRAARIIEQMRLAGRSPVGDDIVFDLADSVRTAADLTLNELMIVNVTLDVELHFDHGEVEVRGNPQLFEQALINIIINAKDAILERHRNEGAEMARGTVRLQAQVFRSSGTVTVTVSDDGGGMSEQTLAHLFEPFYTTKDVGVGMGLGLAIVASTVASMQGALKARNIEGGAELEITLPLLGPEATSG